MAKLAYSSSATNNAEGFVKELGMSACRIPLRPKEGLLRVDEKYVLVVSIYGGGNAEGAVPEQAIKLLNDEHNRSLIRGVISRGNMNFGAAYGLADNVVAVKCHVPHTYRFGLLGAPLGATRVHEDLEKF